MSRRIAERKQLEPVSRVVSFLERLTIPSGYGAGKPFRVRPWQRKIIEGIYGPRNADGKRRVRTAIVSIPRKNGKTGLAAALALYHLIGDGELNGQVICAATGINQASLLYNAARAMVEADPELAELVNRIESTKRLTHRASGSYLATIAADAARAHGLGPSFIVCDEVAQWPKRDLYDALATSTGGREQPLMLVISTQSPDPNNVMSELVDYGRKVNAGVIDDPSFAAFIFEAPADADWQNEAVWHTANPALGDFRSLDEMRTAAARAKRIPAQESAFRTYYLNQAVAADARFLSGADWDACAAPVDIEALEGRPCWGGLDLGSTQDLTSLVLVFPDDGDPVRFDVLPFFWTAADTMNDRGDRDRVPYSLWAQQGYIAATPGRIIDKGHVVRTLAEVAARYDLRGIAFDRWRIEELQKGLSAEGVDVPLVAWGQGFKDMGPAVGALETAVIAGRIRHGGHPVLRWNAANAAVEIDPAGNRKLTKQKSTGRIDGLVALAMALGLHSRTDDASTRSVYERQRPEGLLFI